jgi:glycosyltransferase involved in cell wall biosynthesis
VDSWNPDIVQFEYHVTGQYAAALNGCPAGRVLVQHEPGTAAARDALTRTRGWRRLVAHADTLAWTSYERRIMRRVDRVVAFTEGDRAQLAPLAGSTPVVRIPFGILVPPEPLPEPAAQAHTMLFVGSFRHPPNEDAAARLLAAILPRIRARIPDARLVIVGSDPPAWLLRHQEPGVHVAASVPDVRPFLQEAAVVVAPLRLGGGMRVKVLEGLAAGKAIVASPLAVAGLDVTDGQQLRIAATDEAFADVTVELLHDPAARAALGRRGHRWAASHLSWDAPLNAFGDLYRSIPGLRTAE